MAKKGHCPRCSQRMPLKNRYCEGCGAANPLLFPQPVRRRAAVKSADGSYAPVVSLRPAILRRDPVWTQILASPDPNEQARLLATYIPEFKGGGAA